MRMEPKFFCQDEANALIPILNLEFERVGRLRAELASLAERLGGIEVARSYLEGARMPPASISEDTSQLSRLASEIRSAISRINELGCVIKDLDRGLVDFYSKHRGRVVFLCWQFGESEVGHWHELDQGFANRQRFESVRRELLN